MPFADLREYLNALEKAGELPRVKKEVDPKFELGAICKTIHEKGRKVCYLIAVDSLKAAACRL